MRSIDAILVLGMHRSGTSAVAGWLHHAGLALPDAVLPPHPVDNPHGYFEPRSLVQLNNRLLRAVNLDWQSDGPLSVADLAQAARGAPGEAVDDWLHHARALDRPLVLKDPRLSRLLPIWLPALARHDFSVHCVLVVRSAEAVAASLARRAMHESIRQAAITDGVQSTLLWLLHNLEARRALAQAGLDVHLLAYETFVEQPEVRERLLAWVETRSSAVLDRAAANRFEITPMRSSAPLEPPDMAPDWQRLLEQARALFVGPLPPSRDEAALLQALSEPIPAPQQSPGALPDPTVRQLHGLHVAAGWNPPEVPSGQRRSSPEWLFLSEAVRTRSHIYRVKQPVDALNRLGVSARWLNVEAEPAWAMRGTRVLVVHRSRWTPELARWIDRAREAGARILVDFDDLVFDPALIEDDDIAFIAALDATARARWRADCAAWRETLRAADAALVTTPALARQVEAMGLRAIVKPNGLAPAFGAASEAWRGARPLVDDGCLRIGYASGTPTHERDFALLAPALVEVLKRHRDWKLVLIGAIRGAGVLDALPDNQIERRPRVAWPNLPGELARLDINLAPLEATLFNACKSPLKWLDAAAVGVPTLASDHGAFAHWIEPGRTGLLACTNAQWRAGLERLIVDPDLRRSLGEAARREVAERFSEDRLVEDLCEEVRAQWPGAQ